MKSAQQRANLTQTALHAPSPKLCWNGAGFQRKTQRVSVLFAQRATLGTRYLEKQRRWQATVFRSSWVSTRTRCPHRRAAAVYLWCTNRFARYLSACSRFSRSLFMRIVTAALSSQALSNRMSFRHDDAAVRLRPLRMGEGALERHGPQPGQGPATPCPKIIIYFAAKKCV